jgi:hypothetical protein
MRALKALVIIMGVIIVAGVAVVGITVFNRLSKPASTPVAPVATAPPSTPIAPAPAAMTAPLGSPLPQQFDRKFDDVTLAIPAGARVSDFSASGDRLVLRVVMPDQEQRLLVVDLINGTLLGTIRLTAAGADAPRNSGGGIGLLTPLPQVDVPPRNKNEGLK